jgi:tRNA 5-methylaminomethyl-2-thiouridine biosynthesis bifunctional protein
MSREQFLRDSMTGAHGRKHWVVLHAPWDAGRILAHAWDVMRRDPAAPRRIHVIALEPNPAEWERIGPVASTIPEPLAAGLREGWPLPLPGLHRLEWDGGRLVLTLGFGPIQGLLAQIDARVDAFFLQAAAQARAGSDDGPRRSLARLAAPGAALWLEGWGEASRRGLVAAGFLLEQCPLSGNSDVPWEGRFRGVHRRRSSVGGAVQGESAIVIGAGLAGTSVACRLENRGWSVSLIERHERVAQEASGNLAGVMAPMLSMDDGRAARLSRACFLELRREIRTLERAGIPVRWSECGVLQLAKNAKEERWMESLAAAARYPEQWVRFLSEEEVQHEIPGIQRVRGCLFPLGGWVNPPSLCEARLALAPQVHRLFHASALRIEREGGEWCVWDGCERLVARAPVLVLANALDASRFPALSSLRFKRGRGQVSHLPSALLPRFSRVICRDGYLIPPMDGECCLGATFDFESESLEVDSAGHALNLQRLSGLLGLEVGEPPAGSLTGRVGFRSLTPDRFPVVGPIPDFASTPTSGGALRAMGRLPGLFGLLGLGSRGLVWSALMGEFLASQIAGEPSPLEMDLAEAVDPARFWARSLRGGIA